jgi:hypothetical protein
MLRKGAKPMFLFNTGMKFRHSSNSLQQAQNNAPMPQPHAPITNWHWRERQRDYSLCDAYSCLNDRNRAQKEEFLK